MNYFIGREMGKLAEYMIYDGKILMNTDNNDVEVVKQKCFLVEINEKKKKKYTNQNIKKCIDDYCFLLGKIQESQNRLEVNSLGKELSSLGYDMRSLIPMACQGNIVADKIYLTCIELTIIMMVGILSFMR